MDPPVPSLPATPTRASKKIRTDENDPNNFVAASNVSSNVASNLRDGVNVAASVPRSPSNSGNILVSPTKPGELVNRLQARKEANLNQQYTAALMKEDEAKAELKKEMMKNNQAKAKLEEEKMRGDNLEINGEEIGMEEINLCCPWLEGKEDVCGNGNNFARGSYNTTASRGNTNMLPAGTFRYQREDMTVPQAEALNYRLGYGGYEGNFSGTTRGVLGRDERGKCIASVQVEKDKMRMLVKEGKGTAKNFTNWHENIPHAVYVGGINGVRLVKRDPDSNSRWSSVDLEEFKSDPMKVDAFEVDNPKCRDSLAEALKFTKKEIGGKNPRTRSAGEMMHNNLIFKKGTGITGEYVMTFDMERFHGNTTYDKLGPNNPLQKVAGFRYKISSMKKFSSVKVVSQVQGNNAEADSKPSATAAV